MKRLKFKLATWENGKEFIEKIAKDKNCEISNMDADLRVQSDDFSVNFHPDDRGFAFISCKIFNDEFLEYFTKLKEENQI